MFEGREISRIDVSQDLFHCCGRRRVSPSKSQRNLKIGLPAANTINHLAHHVQLWSAVCQKDICRPGNVYATSISLHTAGSLGFRKCSVSPLPIRNLHQSEVATSRQHGSKTLLSKPAKVFNSTNNSHQYFVSRFRAR